MAGVQDLRSILRRESQLQFIAYIMIVALTITVGLLIAMLLANLQATDLWLLKNQFVQILGAGLLLAAVLYLADNHRRLQTQLRMTHAALEAAQQNLRRSYDHIAFAHHVAGEVVSRPGQDAIRDVLRESAAQFEAEVAAVVTDDVEIVADEGVDQERAYSVALTTAIDGVQSGNSQLFTLTRDGYEVMAAPLRIEGHLQAVVCLMRRDRQFTSDDAAGLELVARVLELGLHNQSLIGQTRKQLQGVLTTVSKLAASRQSDYETHATAVAELSTAVGAELGVKADQLVSLEFAALLHDVGTLFVPAELLAPSRALTDDEKATVQLHPAKGAEIARDASFGEDVQNAILAHHERLDGTGYPRGLEGLEIPTSARIIAACDAFDSMTHGKPASECMLPGEALAELRRSAGSAHDPRVVKVLSKAVRKRSAERTPVGVAPVGMSSA